MSVDKLVDSTQLDSDLTSVANAIRGKTGGSVTLTFPADFVSAINGIPTGGSLETGSQTITATESSQSITMTPSVGYDGFDEVDITVNAIPSNYVGSGVTQRTSSDLTASGATVTAPAGYYASSASKTVASGTAGTPTATKGAVSSHSIAVTPSVTNTTGYISGGTKTGTAVSVSASELVSGTYSVTGSGTANVTNYASISVPSGSATTPATTVTATPSISVSSGGLITASVSTTKSVTPSVSAGYVSSGTAGTVTVSGSNTKQLTAQAAQTIHPSTADKTISSGRYLTGTQTIKGVLLSNLTAGNIKNGVTIKVGDSTDDDCVASVTGTYDGGGGGGGITTTLYPRDGEQSIDFTGSASDLFSVSSNGISIAVVPIYLNDTSDTYNFTCVFQDGVTAYFFGDVGGTPCLAEIYFSSPGLELGGVFDILNGTYYDPVFDYPGMTVYSAT